MAVSTGCNCATTLLVAWANALASTVLLLKTVRALWSGASCATIAVVSGVALTTNGVPGVGVVVVMLTKG